jgi:hypothetical protein
MDFESTFGEQFAESDSKTPCQIVLDRRVKFLRV